MGERRRHRPQRLLGCPFFAVGDMQTKDFGIVDFISPQYFCAVLVSGTVAISPSLHACDVCSLHTSESRIGIDYLQ